MRQPYGATALVEYAAGTTTGTHREVNEDAFGIFEENNVFVVADGCGGRSSGESAANLTVKSFGQQYPPSDFGLVAADPLALAVLAANAEVLREGRSHLERRGQGAALCAVRASARAISVVHIGDCRLGRYREGRLAWLTEDHSLVAELRKSGASSQEIAQVADLHSSVITRAVGTAECIIVDVSYIPARTGDIYLLCTDGLHGQLDRAHISELIGATSRSLRACCAALLDASEAAGGQDNATILLLRLGSARVEIP